jgi:hypothetical protein
MHLAEQGEGPVVLLCHGGTRRVVSGVAQIAVIVLPIFEQRLWQLGQIEIDEPILESIES